MSNFSIDTISAFMAIGKRWTLDVKFHSFGRSTVAIQIDELSFDEFMDQWEKALPDLVRSVNAFFGETLVATAYPDEGYDVAPSGTARNLAGKDYLALANLLDALDHELNVRAETFAAIAEFVNSCHTKDVEIIEKFGDQASDE